jgi:hypothetical protein
VQLREGNKKVKACVPNFCAAWSNSGGCKTRSVALSGNVRTPTLLLLSYGYPLILRDSKIILCTIMLRSQLTTNYSQTTHSPLPMFRILSAFCLLGCHTPDSHRHLLQFMLRSQFCIGKRPVHLMPATALKNPIPSLLHGVVRNKLANLVHMNECQLARNCKV